MKRKKSKFETTVFHRILTSGLPIPIVEYRFDTVRMFRFDFAWPARFIALECEGGIWTNGAHTRGKHFNSDCQKYNLAGKLGWRVLRYTPNIIDDIIPDLKQILGE